MRFRGGKRGCGKEVTRQVRRFGKGGYEAEKEVRGMRFQTTGKEV